MEPGLIFVLAADALLLDHVLFVAFVIIGLAFILIGKHLDWVWVRNPWFRTTHLAAICVVVFQSWVSGTLVIASWFWVSPRPFTNQPTHGPR